MPANFFNLTGSRQPVRFCFHTFPETGVILRVGWTGGGTEFSVPYIQPMVFYSADSTWSPDLGDINPGGAGPDTAGFISYNMNEWYQSTLIVIDSIVYLQTYTDNGTFVGQRQWIMPYEVFDFNFVYIGNSDT